MFARAQAAEAAKSRKRSEADLKDDIEVDAGDDLNKAVDEAGTEFHGLTDEEYVPNKENVDPKSRTKSGFEDSTRSRVGSFS